MISYGKELSAPQIPDRLTGNPIEVGGITVKCISSNVRRTDIPWNEMQVVSGVGMEGNLVVVEALSSSGFRTEIENQYGRDEKIYEGDRFVAVLANRHSGTSESGDVPIEGIDITTETELHLLAAGAIVGIKSGVPGRLEPLSLKTLGLITHNGKPVDLVDLCGGHHEFLVQSAPIIMVCGTSAEVGKTTTSAAIIRALKGEETQMRQQAEEWLKAEVVRASVDRKEQERTLNLLQQVKDEELRYVKAFGSGAIEEDHLKSLLVELKKKRQSYELQLRAMENTPYDSVIDSKKVDKLCEEAMCVLQSMLQEEKKKVVQDIIEKVTIFDKGEVRVAGHLPQFTQYMAYEPERRNCRTCQCWQINVV